MKITNEMDLEPGKPKKVILQKDTGRTGNEMAKVSTDGQMGLSMMATGSMDK